VDDALYARFKDFVDQHPKDGIPPSFPELLPSRKTHTVYFIPDITWDRPRHSQVIHWKQP
jgi:hypothetical protein